jgi:Sulfotransferase domain
MFFYIVIYFITIFSPICLYATENDISKKGPDFLLLGAQKSATTSLFYYLIKHPQLLGPASKEIHYFDLYLEKGIDWYCNQFPTKITSDQLVFEATPENLLFSYVPEMINHSFPDIKFIVSFRNPIDRAFSQYRHYRRNGLELRDFDQIVEEELARMEQDIATPPNIDQLYLIRGLYQIQLERWLKYFPASRFHLVIFEDLVENTDQVMQRIYDFLGVSRYYQFHYKKQFKAPKDGLVLKIETREKLENFYHPYNKQFKKFLKETMKSDLAIDW